MVFQLTDALFFFFFFFFFILSHQLGIQLFSIIFSIVLCRQHTAKTCNLYFKWPEVFLTEQDARSYVHVYSVFEMKKPNGGEKKKCSTSNGNQLERVVYGNMWIAYCPLIFRRLDFIFRLLGSNAIRTICTIFFFIIAVFALCCYIVVDITAEMCFTF